MSTIIQNIERSQLREGIPSFDPGDRVKVHFQVIEGNRRRTQVFEGVVIRRQGSGLRETFTVRKQSFGVGVERTFPLHSPKIEQLEVAARGDVRRAKLYYLRGRIGKAARVAERRWGAGDDVAGVKTAAVAASGQTVAEEAAADEAAVEQTEPEAVEPAAGEGEAPEAEAAAAEEAASEEVAPEQPEAGGAGEPDADEKAEDGKANESSG